MPLNEPTRRERLEWETDLFGFAVSGHPLELYADVAWDTYCPVNRLGEFVGETVTTCGLVVEQRTHHQITGEPSTVIDELWRPIAAEQRERRNRGEALTHKLVELPATSRRSERLLGPLQALLVDG